ncbi:hypothetical protein SAV14893_040670 [Streptomyces avermitilis]|uniref:Uncharacterized protein n=1 Tax=Streptomyces avermitilis TaxID=33903 RepID=A0A4D4LW20_STRAX|nr:hypothetical protein SAV14893_040670 [Streptomyces avermitilis]
MEVADALVAVVQRGYVRPDQRGDRGEEEQDAADGLGAQRLRDEVPLGQREPSEELAGAGAGGGHGGNLRVGTAC